MRATCQIPDCLSKHLARGYCRRHYAIHIERGTRERRSPAIHLEDVEWMADTGEVWERAVERLGVKDNTLLRHLERAGRYDLIRKLKRRIAA